MSKKGSNPAKTIVLLLVIAACAGGVYYFTMMQGGNGTVSRNDMHAWVETEMIDEQLTLDELKQRVGNDNAEDVGEGRYRFTMSQVDSANPMVFEVAVRGGRVVSKTIITPGPGA
ncbi:MAG: hypothetical protein AAFX79_09880 [Planctomycetota bacterium]